MTETGDIVASRLDAAQFAANFADAHPPLSPAQAVVEASRCCFCHDAPCVEACPTGIDVPSFVRKIATGNLLGFAATILESNILGGSCARVCPTEELCERACVRTAQEHQPIQIGALQRHATDWLMEQSDSVRKRTVPFHRAGLTAMFVTHSVQEAVFLSTRIVVMSSRPGRIVTVIESSLKPERDPDVRETPEFLAVAHAVRAALREGHDDG